MWHRGFSRIGRNRMEFKLVKAKNNTASVNCIGRNRMEFKCGMGATLKA